MNLAILLTPWLRAIGDLLARKIFLRVTVRARLRLEDAHAVIGKALTRWFPITLDHARMEGGSRVNGRVVHE